MCNVLRYIGSRAKIEVWSRGDYEITFLHYTKGGCQIPITESRFADGVG